MLESPAIIDGGVEMMSERPVFTTEEQGGYMLITEKSKLFPQRSSKMGPTIICFDV